MPDARAGYKYLVTYQLAVVIFDLTVEFCDLYIDTRSRTHDQMVQAGRSGKQNIAEGYLERSLKSYIKLLGVALASIGELLEDYQDFLRQRGLPQWNKEDPKVREMRAVRVVGDSPHIPQFPHIPHDPVLAANLMITLCQRATYLLKRQIESLEQKFVNEGGYTEKLFKKRLSYRISHPPHVPHTP